MTIADFKEKIVLGRTPGDQGYYPPRSIIRTPGNEHSVSGADIAEPLAGDNQTKKARLQSSNGKPRPCVVCPMPAAKGDIFCEDCRSGINCP